MTVNTNILRETIYKLQGKFDSGDERYFTALYRIWLRYNLTDFQTELLETAKRY